MSVSNREQFMLKSGKLLSSLAVASSAVLLCTAFVSAKEIPIAKEIPGPSVYQKMEDERSRLQDLMRDGNAKSQLPIDEIKNIPYEKNGRYILPDLRTGEVKFEHPVTTAPGTNGLTPDVSVGFIGNTSTVSANITTLDKIEPCWDNANQHCLGDNHLVPQDGGKRPDVIRYYIRSWPSVVISRNENGWTFISKEGLKRSYSQLNEKSEVFQLSRVEDSFGNFIDYQYGKSGGNISLIRYGQRAVSEGALRKIRFHYRGSELSEVVSQVGGIVFQKISISYKNGKVVALQECSFVEQSTSCRPKIDFIWSEEGVPVLKTILQGKALKTHISYGNSEGHSVVKTIGYELSGKLLKTDRFEFVEALVANGESKGFAQVWWYQGNKQTGRYLEYGKGLSHGSIIESGVFKAPEDPTTFLKEQPILSSKSKHYQLAQLQHGEFLLLDRVETTGVGEEGTSTTFYEYDEFGRLVEETTGPLARSTFYVQKNGMLDSGDIHRIQKIQVVDSQNEAVVERQFEYRFEGEKLRGIYERISDSKKPNEIAISKYIFDDFGNVVEHIGKDGVATKVAYETEYATFPNHMSVEGPGHREEVVLRFDPRFGTQISAHYADGSFENVVLGSFGLVRARSEKYKDPILKHASDKEYSAIEIIDYSETPSGELMKSFRKLQKAPDQARSELSKVTRITDAYGRLKEFVAVKHDARGVVVQKSRIEQNFVGEGRQMSLFQNGQLLQEAHFDQYGQVVYEKSGEYGESHFTYDENGQVIQVNRGQESLSLQYDELGRIEEKTLPNGKVYKFQYGEGNKSQPTYVQLPSGKELFFSYNAKGHTTEKVVRLPSVTAGNKSPEFRVSYKYKNDQLSEVTYPNGSRVAYIYERGKLSDIRWISASDKSWIKSGASIARFETGRSPDGKFLKKHLANGIVEKYKWGRNGKIEGIAYANPSNASENYLDVKYHGDFTSKLASESISGQSDGSQFSSNLSYKYNDYGHLKTVQYSDDEVSKSPNKIEMDMLEQRLLNAEKDGFGNLIFTKKFSGSFAAQHEFDIENKLISSVVNDRGKNSVVEYDYDHFGKRIEKSVIGGDTTYFIDPFYEIRISTDEEIEERLFVWDHMGKIASFKRKLKEDQLTGIVAGSTGKTTGVVPGFSALSSNGLDQAFDNLLTQEIEKEVSFVISSLLLTSILVFLAKSSVFHFVSRAKSVATCLVMISYGTLCVAPTAYAVQSSLLNVSAIPNVVFYHHGIRGSLVAWSNDEGVLMHLPRHTPYGALPEAVAEKEYQYAGQEYDAETGLYYAGARYYDPDRGVFLSPDPLRASNNPYEYASGDPINLIDLSGQAPHEPIASSAPDEDNSDEEPPLEVVVSASSPSAPASAVEMASAADGAPPVASADDGGDEEIIDEPDRWVRYPTFSRITFGYQDEVDIPEYDEVDPAYEDADEDEYNQYVRSEYMQGWTRFGGFVQALGSAFLLALFASTSFEYDDGEVAEAGFGRDLLANFLMLLTFIGFSYGYSGNEADYWAGVQKRKAKAKDYWLVSARRIMWKVSFQLVTFPLLMVARNSIRGYPAFADEDPSSTDKLNYLFYNMLRFTPYSLIGNMALLPFFAIFKEPYPGYDDAMTDEKLAAHSWGSRQLIRAALAYRGFAGRKGFWDQDFEEGSWNRRLQNAWYPLNILQLYMWFAVGSCGYYGGLAIMIGKVPGFDQAAFYQAWRRNAILLSLCPPASPLTIINFWHRKSFTIVKKRSWKNPRTEGAIYRILGPIEGLRLAKFDDTGYLDAHDWMPKLQLIREAVSDEAIDGTEGGHHEHHMNEPSASEPAP